MVTKAMAKLKNNRVMKSRPSIYFLALLLISMAGINISCEDEKPGALELSRMFRPGVIEVTNGETSVGIEWSKPQFPEQGSGYTLEIAETEDFAAITHTLQTAENQVVITDDVLAIKKDYFARIKANGKTAAEDSQWAVSEVFRITGEQFLLVPPAADIIDVAIILKWRQSDELTKIVLSPQGGESIEVLLDDTDRAAAQKLIEDLLPATQYTAEIFAGTKSKGTQQFATKAPDFVGDNTVIDLRNILNKPTILVDTLPDIPNGSVVILKRGQTYRLSAAYAFNKSVTILSGIDFGTDLAKIELLSNFNFVASSVVDSVIFKDIRFKGARANGASFDNDYVLNVNVATTVGKIKLDGCRITRVRGVVRLQAGGAGAKVANYIVNNCVIDSVREFAIVMASAASSFANVKISNSTIYRARRFVNHNAAGNNSLIIENCTLNELPTGEVAGGVGNYLIDFNTFGSANPIILRNNIIGKTWIETAGSVDVRGYRGAGPITITDCFATSDFVSTNPTFQLGFSTYSGTAASVFTAPDTGNFKVKDAAFPGKTVGDPRWK